MRGVFTCGVLDYMMDHGVEFPYAVGVSAGACNGLSYMSRQRGRAKYSNIDLLDNRQLLLLSVATSIDAVAVGISMAFIEFAESRIYIDLLILAAVSAIAAFAGLSGAAKIRERFCWKASLAGGIILIFLGVKILVEHIC